MAHIARCICISLARISLVTEGFFTVASKSNYMSSSTVVLNPQLSGAQGTETVISQGSREGGTEGPWRCRRIADKPKREAYYLRS